MKLCVWCKKREVNDPRAEFCSKQCWGKARAARNRKGSVEPPPVVGAGWLPLADGRWALVDADLHAEMARYSWVGGGSKSQYARTQIEPGLALYLHQMILPGVRVDHKNGNTLDCRRDNLRPGTARQNAANMKSRAKKVPYKGIHVNGPNWAASIRIQGKRVHLGQFATPEEAARAYDAAARKVHGEFACVNFPEEGERGALQ